MVPWKEMSRKLAHFETHFISLLPLSEYSTGGVGLKTASDTCNTKWERQKLALNDKWKFQLFDKRFPAKYELVHTLKYELGNFLEEWRGIPDHRWTYFTQLIRLKDSGRREWAIIVDTDHRPFLLWVFSAGWDISGLSQNDHFQDFWAEEIFLQCLVFRQWKWSNLSTYISWKLDFDDDDYSYNFFLLFWFWW